jgi:hypothetical protein
MDSLEHLEQQALSLGLKVDKLTEALYASALASQAALAELRTQLTSLEHLFGCLNEHAERTRFQVAGNPTGGLLERVTKLEFEALRVTEQRKRNLGAVWAVLGGVVVYLVTQVLGKVL